MRQDLAGVGHGLERGDRHGVPGQVRRTGAGAGSGLPGRRRTAGRANALPAWLGIAVSISFQSRCM